MIYQFLDKTPQFDDSVFVAPSADLIGDVSLGEESSVWFNATLRGDVNWIRLGRRTNVQDNVCIHVTRKSCPTQIGDRVTIGHSAMLHGCTVHDRVLVGIQSTILDRAEIEPDCVIAAGSLVPPGKRLQSGYLYMGSPVRQVRELSDEERKSILEYADNYVTYSRAYKQVDTYDSNPFYDPKT